MKQALIALFALLLFSCGADKEAEAKKQLEAKNKEASAKVEQQLQEIETESKAIIDETKHIEEDLDALINDL